MTSIRLLMVLFALMSVGIIRCSDKEKDKPTEVVEKDGRILITKDNAAEYIDVVITILTLQNNEYPNSFNYSHQIRLKHGVICESDITLYLQISFVITYQYVDTEFSINQTATVPYAFDQSNVISYHESQSDVLIRNGFILNTVANIELITVLNITSSYIITGGQGEVTLDSNYQP